MNLAIRLVGLAALSAALSACCSSDVRFWRTSDGGRTLYSVDTPGAPLLAGTEAEFVDESGRLVALSDFELEPATAAQFVAGTNGSGWSASFCPNRWGCWAQARPSVR